MKKYLIGLIFLGGTAWAAPNLWELRDQSNTKQVWVDSSRNVMNAEVSPSIGAGMIDSSKLATPAVYTANIANGAVDTGKLGDDSVTSSKILDSAVGTSKIANGAVDTGKLADDSVTGSKILNATIGAEKLSFSPGVSWPLGAPNGGMGAPSYSWSNDTASGLYYEGAPTASVIMSVGNSAVLKFQNTAVEIGSSKELIVRGNQGNGGGLKILGGYTAAELQALACPSFSAGSKVCMAINLTDYDLYTSTGSGVGDWRNSRTGVGP
jgi:hypothetical protein